MPKPPEPPPKGCLLAYCIVCYVVFPPIFNWVVTHYGHGHEPGLAGFAWLFAPLLVPLFVCCVLLGLIVSAADALFHWLV